MTLRLVLLALALAAAAGASWAIPRLTAAPERMQVALALIGDGRAGEAVHLLDDPSWRGVAEYRAGRYERALGEFFLIETVGNFYNMGNAYARLHKWSAARLAYLNALRLDPGHEDAAFNLALIDRAEAAEQALLAEERRSLEQGRWEDGNRRDTRTRTDGAGEITDGGADRDARRPAEAEAAGTGESDIAGRPGEARPEADPRAGRAEGSGVATAPDAMQAGASGAPILRESTGAAETLLRRIADDPATVLRARLRAAHRLRQERGASCAGC